MVPNVLVVKRIGFMNIAQIKISPFRTNTMSWSLPAARARHEREREGGGAV